MSEPVGYRIEISRNYRDGTNMIIREVEKVLFGLKDIEGDLIIEIVVGEDDEVS
jgi:hypothetical protein